MTSTRLVAPDFAKIISQLTLIDERFAPIRSLTDEGHFSLVFLAEDQHNGNKVVLKIMHPNHMPAVPQDDDYRWKCFQREVEILENIPGSCHVVQKVANRSVFLSSDEDGRDWEFHYYGIEVALGSVSDRLANDSWSERERLLAFREMCEAVQYIHNPLC